MLDIRLTSAAIMRSFSKFTRPSTSESFPRLMKVKSLFTSGKNGICNKDINLTVNCNSSCSTDYRTNKLSKKSATDDSFMTGVASDGLMDNL